MVISGGRRIRQIWPPAIFFSGATSKQRFTNNVPKLWKLWRRRYDRKLLLLHLKWFSRSWTTAERGYISVSVFKAATWVMFCSKHVDVKRHSVYFPEIKKTFAVSSLVLNLLASQIGDFLLPHPVYSFWLFRQSAIAVTAETRSEVFHFKITPAKSNKCHVLIMVLMSIEMLEHVFWGHLTLILLMWRIGWAHNNARK